MKLSRNTSSIFFVVYEKSGNLCFSKLMSKLTVYAGEDVRHIPATGYVFNSNARLQL